MGRGAKVQRLLGQDADWGPEDFTKGLQRRSLTISYFDSPRGSPDPENPYSGRAGIFEEPLGNFPQ